VSLRRDVSGERPTLGDRNKRVTICLCLSGETSPTGLHGQTGPAGHAPQLLIRRGASAGVPEQHGEGVADERVTQHTMGVDRLSATQRPYCVVVASPQVGQSPAVVAANTQWHDAELALKVARHSFDRWLLAGHQDTPSLATMHAHHTHVALHEAARAITTLIDTVHAQTAPLITTPAAER
jgi:hypothetical protein